MLRTLLFTLCIAILSSSARGFVEFSQQRPKRQRSATSSNDDEKEVAKRIMYNQQSRRRESIHYQIVAAEATEAVSVK